MVNTVKEIQINNNNNNKRMCVIRTEKELRILVFNTPRCWFEEKYNVLTARPATTSLKFPQSGWGCSEKDIVHISQFGTFRTRIMDWLCTFLLQQHLIEKKEKKKRINAQLPDNKDVCVCVYYVTHRKDLVFGCNTPHHQDHTFLRAPRTTMQHY